MYCYQKGKNWRNKRWRFTNGHQVITIWWKLNECLALVNQILVKSGCESNPSKVRVTSTASPYVLHCLGNKRMKLANVMMILGSIDIIMGQGDYWDDNNWYDRSSCYHFFFQIGITKKKRGPCPLIDHYNNTCWFCVVNHDWCTI